MITLTTHPTEACTLLAEDALSDEELMKQIAKRNPEALAQLFDRYSAVLKALIIRVVHDETEADDLLQEIFMQVWRQSENYSQQKGKPLGWLVTLSRRRAIDRLRKRQAYCRAKERFEIQIEPQVVSWNHNRIDGDICREDIRAFLNEHIANLPLYQKEAIELAYFSGMSQREIALATHTPLGTIKTRLELGLRKLSEAVQKLRDKI
jgi:RNA polymerase sigma-70 factor (ECF subfamily)